MSLPEFSFIPARGFTPANRTKLDLVVFHDMEAPEKGSTAEQVARYFQTTSRDVSSHYCIDNDSIVQCVKLKDVAWCAPGSNHNGIQLEHAGYAGQTRGQWLDAYSLAMLDLSARLTAKLCKEYDIPIQFVTADALALGVRGITTHAAVSLAFRRSTHTDPGAGFPMDVYIGLVKKYSKAAPVSLTGWPKPIPKWFWAWAAWHLQGRKSPRPTTAPRLIPPWAWRRLLALRKGRQK